MTILARPQALHSRTAWNRCLSPALPHWLPIDEADPQADRHPSMSRRLVLSAAILACSQPLRAHS